MKMKIFLLLVFLAISAKSYYSQDLFINEIMTSNTYTLADEDGDYSDWIEIFNDSDAEINLQGFFISDDPSNLMKWEFGNILVPPNGYLLVFASDKDRKGEIFYWNTVIDWGDEWKYITPNAAVNANWINLNYDDANWLNGSTGIGYGDNDDETIISQTISIYARKKFNIENIENIIGAILHIDFDDSFVAYLNGTEFARANIGTVGIPPAFDDLAISDEFEAKIYQGGFPSRYDVENIESLIQEGDNIIAIQIHNLDLGSSDLSFIPFFTLQQKSANNSSNPPEILQLTSSNIHTNFKLKSAGEIITLTNQDGFLLDSVYSASLESDISYGRQPDGSENWFYFGFPTPNSSNITAASDSLIPVDTVQFSAEGGFYNSRVTLELTSTNAQSLIYYTRDGSVPNENSIKINGPISINRTMVIRAVAINPSGRKSEVNTFTYFIGEDRPLPVFSISMKPENFYQLYENFDLEVPINIEMYERNGNLAFNHKAGAEVFGSGSAQFEQKSLAIFFRGKYGVGELKYKMFPDRPFEEYESFLLRNGGNDWWSTLIRDPMTSNGLMEGTNLDFQAYRPSIVYINGEYWGIHNIREKVNEHFIRDHHYVEEENLDMLEYKEVITPEIIHGDLENYNVMIDFLTNNDMNDSANFAYIEEIIDIDSYINYQIIEIYCANIDWPANNNRFWRSRSNDGKWRWILYDTDTGFGLWSEDYDPPGWELNHFEHATNDSYSLEEGWPNPSWSTFIFRKLLENDSFRNKFINLFADYLNTRLSSDNALKVISDFKRGINNAIPRHLDRWYRYLGDYDYQIKKITDFATFRPKFVREQIIDFFDLNETVNISVGVEPNDAGKIKINSQIVSSSLWSGKYFNGNPIQLTADANSGYKFVGWDGALTPSSRITLDPYDGMVIKAIFEPDTTGSVVINEINYNSNNIHDPGDWIEIFNNTNMDIDLTGWYFNDAADSNRFVLPAGTILNQGEYLVLSREIEKFSNIFPSSSNVVGDFEFGLNAGGDTLRIYDINGEMIDSVAYLNGFPWTQNPDGNGPTLELINPELDNLSYQNWSSSIYLGTPGEENSSFDIIYEEGAEVGEESADYGIIQNYPNPFLSSTKISYKIEFPSNVELKIFNMLGQEIRSFIGFQQTPNEYTIVWNGRNNNGREVSSGVYIYVLEINFEVSKIKKMVKL